MFGQIRDIPRKPPTAFAVFKYLQFKRINMSKWHILGWHILLSFSKLLLLCFIGEETESYKA